MERIMSILVRMVMRQVARRAVNKGIDMVAGQGSSGPKFQKQRHADGMRVVRRMTRL